MSYRKKHIKSRIHKVKPRKSILRRPWFWIILLCLTIIFSAAYFFLFYSGTQIKNIVISGNQKVASKDIEDLVSNNINNKILGIGGFEVNSKSIFIVNSDKLQKEILHKFPIIESVKIEKKLMQALNVEVNERTSVAVFCPPTNDEHSENAGCYFIDINGIIFESVNEMPSDMVIVRQETNDIQISVGEQVVQPEVMSLISKVGKSLKDNFQINLKTATIISPTRLDIETQENWQAYFGLGADYDINLQITKLNLLLSDGISPDARKNLRYIDLRPKDRAVVCDNTECGK